ncbi:MAG: hypothetical protein JJU45_11975 [Acidimicrobiia bacterium]|nr:hypothetical protein [Acidimicrobiia bacterium]
MIRLRYDVRVEDPDELLTWYQEHVRRGPDYYRHHLTGGDPSRVEFGDLAWAVLLEGQPRSGAAQSLLSAAVHDDSRLKIGHIPDEPLHSLSEEQRSDIVAAVVAMTGLHGFRAAVATKTMHPKRRHSIPVLDNRAVFGTLANPNWTLGQPQRSRSATQARDIRPGLDAVYQAVADPESQGSWQELEQRWQPMTRIELLDMCWWATLHR